ncbi:MAG: YceD family protein [Burkholderiaceae bacterium]
MRAFVIDAFEFSRLKERAEGEFSVAELGRLAAECVDSSGSVEWSLQGGADQYGHPQLQLWVTATLQLMCQRCLTPFPYRLNTHSVLIMAPDEVSADAIEERLADDTVDVIVGSRQMGVAALVEDDALLAIPPAPKHEVCPDDIAAGGLQGAEKPSPFAVLKKLKQ